VEGLDALAAGARQEPSWKARTVTVDVVVPVSNVAGGARRCFESLLSERQAAPFEIIAVSDAPADTALISWLRLLADQRRIKLIEQAMPQGLAAALNRAIALHRGLDRDVVILGDDTEVTGDWLDRLARPAASDEVGTVVPFASSGGVAGYPKSSRTNAMPAELTLASLDRLIQRANAGVAVDLPLAFGPCLYVRRACLDAIGAFSPGPQGGDDGVLEDFSLRASNAGFRHVLAADCYVWHSDVAAAAAEATERAYAVLDKRYPQFRALRAELAQHDPVRPLARRVDLLRLAESPRQLILFIAHAWGGGIRRHMDELAALVSDRCNVLLLEPAVEDTVKISWMRDDEGFAAYFTLPQDMSELTRLLGELGLARIHFHHVHGLPRAVLDLPRSAALPYDCTLHDYYPVCPQYHLVTEEGRYCGEPDAAGCAACIGRRPSQWGLDIAQWRATFETLLHGADRVIAPSRDLAQRIARYFPDIDVTILPHAETQPAAARVVRVATLGGLSPEKGLRVVAACAEDARARGLPLAFRVLGWTAAPLAQWPRASLSVHGQYTEDELPSLIAAERPDVIWFPAQVPESYSYTLTAALASGAAIVASALGALPERLAGYQRATLLPADASPAQWNEALIAAGTLVGASRATAARVAVS
jgi:glycosyltransferase involved in cell wall biosynthesis